jgi:hypothetical protein
MTIDRLNKDDLRQDVLEQTEMLRTHQSLAGLRVALQKKGIDPISALLASFAESEELLEYGTIVAANGAVFHYVRDNGGGEATSFQEWTEILDISEFSKQFPWVPVALEYLRGSDGK